MSEEAILILQAIHTQWSKRARGAPLAVARNQVPVALPIPMDQVPPVSSGYLIHYVVFSEEDAFADAHFNVTKTHRREEICRYDPVLLRLHGLTLTMPHSSLRLTEGISETFEVARFGLLWDEKVEVVDLRGHSPARARRALTLRLGEWGRIRCNRRLTVEAGWVYEQWTINVALTSCWATDLFEKAPNYVYERMNQLR